MSADEETESRADPTTGRNDEGRVFLDMSPLRDVMTGEPGAAEGPPRRPRDRSRSRDRHEDPNQLATITELLLRLVRAQGVDPGPPERPVDPAPVQPERTNIVPIPATDRRSTLDRFDRRQTLPSRGGGRRSTLFGAEPSGLGQYALLPPVTGTRAKLRTPPVFDGTYTELYNILNWIVTLERYLFNCNVEESLYPSYAYTYMSPVVQAWFDNIFLSQPRVMWDPTVTQALKDRYLHSDHEPRLLRKFTQTCQKRSLADYVDQFQILVSALQLANIRKSQTELVRQFIDGLKNFEDRMSMLTQRVKTIEGCYEMATVIRSARHVATNREAGFAKYNRLTGEAKKKAFRENACLECGSKTHWYKTCPRNKDKSFYQGPDPREKDSKYKSTSTTRAKKGSKSGGKPVKRNFHMAAGAPDSDEAADTDPALSENSEERTEVPEESGTDSPNEEPDSSGGEESG